MRSQKLALYFLVMLCVCIVAGRAEAIICPNDSKSESDSVAYVQKMNMWQEESISIERDFDLNRDEKNDLLIGAGCGNAGCNYYVFLKNSSDGFRYSGHGFFHKAGFKIISVSGADFEILAYLRGSVDRGSLVRLRSHACGDFEKLAETQGSSEELFNFVKEFPTIY